MEASPVALVVTPAAPVHDALYIRVEEETEAMSIRAESPTTYPSGGNIFRLPILRVNQKVNVVSILERIAIKHSNRDKRHATTESE